MLTTFLFEAANFLVLTIALAWLFFKPVRQALADHREKLESLAQQARQEVAQAQAAQAEVEQQRHALRDEIARLRSETLELARREADETIALAREHASKIKESARQHVKRLDETQITTLSQAVATAAGVVVERLLEQISGSDLGDALLGAACRQLAGLELDATPVMVQSARPLDEASRARLDAALGRAASRAMYRVSTELGSGVRVTTSAGLVDASVAGLAEFARRSLLAELERQTNEEQARGR